MPWKPKAPCPRCRRVTCVCTTEQKRGRPAWQGTTPTRQSRPGYDAERRRRRAFVKAELHHVGEHLGNNVWLAVCELCGVPKALPFSEWWADHVHPVALGGSEAGPLRLSCASCQRRQGARLARERGQPGAE